MEEMAPANTAFHAEWRSPHEASLQPQRAVTQTARAWERKARPAFAARFKQRRVWKRQPSRFLPRQPNPNRTNQTSLEIEEPQDNTSKKRCIMGVDAVAARGDAEWVDDDDEIEINHRQADLADASASAAESDLFSVSGPIRKQVKNWTRPKRKFGEADPYIIDSTASKDHQQHRASRRISRSEEESTDMIPQQNDDEQDPDMLSPSYSPSLSDDDEESLSPVPYSLVAPTEDTMTLHVFPSESPCSDDDTASPSSSPPKRLQQELAVPSNRLAPGSPSPSKQVSFPEAYQPSPGTLRSTSYVDDTDMLKGFLDRVKAEKAAKILDEGEDTCSPTKLRAPLGMCANNSPSPRKIRKPVSPGAGVLKRRSLALEAENTDILEPSQDGAGQDEGMSFRRSRRKAIPVAVKPGGPARIPLRRADGSEQPVLQKNASLELARVTRLNTRKNQGQVSTTAAVAVMQNRDPSAAAASPVRATRSKSGKSVTWHEQLAQYRSAEKEREREREKRGTRALRSQRIGTPTPKRRVKV